MLRKRLFYQVYLTIVGSLILVVLAAGALWRFSTDHNQPRQAIEFAGKLAMAALPPENAPLSRQRRVLKRLSKLYDVNLALYGEGAHPIVATGKPLPLSTYRRHNGPFFGRHGPGWALSLPDGRWLVARPSFQHTHHPAFRLITFLGVIALVIALGAHPVVRRLTRRLERLQTGVNLLGAGDLSARVKVEGKDEVARLAESFNRAASRIEELVGAHKLLLANASHELRTPLSRIRLGVELLKEKADPAHKAGLENDITELDRLIDEILLASRLDAISAPDVVEEIDLLALAAEEAAHFDDCTVEGEPVIVKGDPWLLRRMIRNLLENAGRHGAPPIEVDVRETDRQAVLAVADQGAGIPAADHERVFSPFQRLPSGENTNGAGLGLALVRQIARRHAGDAVILPSKTHQSRFVVRLPLSA
ncbi:MAG: ATP-binding protein [Alphaproteobacteria bacterium]